MTHVSRLDRTLLLQRIAEEFRLDWRGVHGAPHWGRVLGNGRRLAARTGADPLVVELFAWLHDACRWNDFADPEHGERAARFALELRGSAFDLEEPRLELLLAACRGHSGGGTEGEVTVLTCWDADRLDLGRVGIEPHPDRLCTDAARDPDVLAWAYARSLAREFS